MLYAIGLGSNQRHPLYGAPRDLIEEALRRLPGILLARSRTIASRPLGPSLRTYANSAAIIECGLEPPDLLAALQAIETDLGRLRRGQRWRARPMDCDILLWEGGIWADGALTIPHRELAKRDFVLRPLAEIARAWHDPVTGLTMGHLRARLRKAKGAR